MGVQAIGMGWGYKRQGIGMGWGVRATRYRVGAGVVQATEYREGDKATGYGGGWVPNDRV